MRGRLEPAERFTLGQPSDAPLTDADHLRHHDPTDERPHTDANLHFDVILLVLDGEHTDEDLYLHLHSTSTSTSTTSASSPSPTKASGPTSGTPGTSATASPVPAASSSTPVWLWIVLALLLIAGIVAYVLRRRSNRAAAAEVHRRALDAYASAMALHDQAAVLPMTADVDRPRVLGDVSASLDRVSGEFDALAAEPAMHEASAEIGDVRLSLGNLRAALQAQVAAGGIDPDLLRERLADLDAALQRLRQRLSRDAVRHPPAPH